MPLLFDLPLYVVYALLGTSSASLAKASLHAVHRREWGLAALRFAGASAALLCNFALLLYLMDRADMSVMVPVAVGLNILTAAVIAWLFFRERITRIKAGAMALIVTGVILLSLG